MTNISGDPQTIGVVAAVIPVSFLASGVELLVRVGIGSAECIFLGGMSLLAGGDLTANEVTPFVSPSVAVGSVSSL